MAEYLSFPNRVHLINSFEFTNDRFLNENIHPQPFVKRHAVIDNWKIKLPLVSQTSFG